MFFLNKLKKDYYFREVLRLATPVILGQIMFVVLNFADKYYISRLGTVEAAGASLSGNLIWMMITISSLITGGTVAMISRKVGEKNLTEVKRGAEQSLFLAYILGIVLAVIGFLTARTTFAFFGAASEVTNIGLDYYDVYLFGFPFIISGMVAGAIFQSSGNTKLPMIIFTCMSLANLIMDPFFIFDQMTFAGFNLKGLNLGVKGAALASVLAHTGAFFYAIYRLKIDKNLPVRNVFFIKPETSIIFRILKIGIWTGLNSLSRPLSAIFLQKVVAYHGTNCIAAFSFGIQWISIIFIFMEGLKIAISTIVGQELGKKSITGALQAIKAGNIFGYTMLGICLFSVYPFSENLISIFSSVSEVISAGSGYLKITLIGMIFGIPMTVYGSVFNGAGDTMPPTIIAFIANWLGKIGFAYLATYVFHFNINSVWLAIAISLCIEGLLMYVWFLRGNWKKIRI